MKKILYIKNVYFLLFFLLITACKGKEIVLNDELLVGSHILKVEYVNFIPRKVDKACLSSHVKRLRAAIIDKELLRQKHISYKGNHEWRKITASHYLRITDEKDAFYLMFSMEPMVLLLLDKPYDALKEDDTFAARWLKDPIDLHECIED